ncbi:hypothetical protein [Pseudoroseicyclus sp. CXY001]|uniref:hypothetical protein n=1 Tax=Pseudoroseicyclus sp. CXY001 TaxID=3242492 RepID=UPI0035716EFA
MSNPDSFIDEVSEALRRDQFARAFRRWWWVGAVIVVVIVGGAALYEWRELRARTAAEALGAAMLDAMDAAEPAERVAALDAIPADGTAAPVVAMLAAAEEMVAEDPAAAADRLDAIAAMPGLETPYGDLAALKAAMLRIGTLPEHEIRQRLEPLATAGAPFRLLAEEQIALSELRDGQVEDARARLGRIKEDAEALPSMTNRIDALLIALGATGPTAAEEEAGADSEDVLAEETLAEEPVAEPALEEPAVEEAPAEQPLVDEAPAEEAPAAEAPATDEAGTPTEEAAPADETAAEEAPAAEAPASPDAGTPAEEVAPADEAPAEEAPAAEAPESPDEAGTPAEEATPDATAPGADAADAAPAEEG